MTKPSAAIQNLTECQRQLDEGGEQVGVSRQALDEVLAYVAAHPRKHQFWGAGEPDCPPEIKAGNGEIHTLMCKVCGAEGSRNTICGGPQ